MAGFDFSQCDILVIDDQEVIRAMVRGLLLRLGVRSVQQAANGTEGLAALSDKLPTCVLCDIGMPHMNGLEFAKTVRADNAAAPYDLPIALLTGFSDTEIVDTALALDVNAFILKPVSGQQLGARLSRVLTQPMQLQLPTQYAAIELPDLKIPIPGREPPPPPGPGIGVRLTPPPPPPPPSFAEEPRERMVQKRLKDVQAGAVLARDVRAPNGKLLLTRDRQLSQSLLDRLGDLSELHPTLANIWIRI